MATKRLDPLNFYREYAEFQLAMDGEGLGLRSARQALADMSLTPQEQQSLADLDELVIASVQDNPYINPVLLKDDATQPLHYWWWHLGKLRVGAYPAELLPEQLRAIYRQRELAHAF